MYDMIIFMKCRRNICCEICLNRKFISLNYVVENSFNSICVQNDVFYSLKRNDRASHLFRTLLPSFAHYHK